MIRKFQKEKRKSYILSSMPAIAIIWTCDTIVAAVISLMIWMVVCPVARCNHWFL